MSLDSRNAVWGALPPVTGGSERPLDLADHGEAVTKQIVARLLSKDFDAWSDAASRVGFCSNPIHLVGTSTTFDKATGEVLSTYSSADEALGSTVVRCGNRRESVCPSCSRLYAADMFQLIRAGVTGGKTVPERVAENPLVFATVTAPSFGHVHGTRDHNRRCRPHGSASRCPHGRATTCMSVHGEDDPLLGQPLCRDCYDYESHVVWQWWAPELWRRFTIALKRALARQLHIAATRLADVVTVQYAKVGEYQRRGLVHFHALIRMDGARDADGGFGAAPREVTAGMLAKIVRDTVAAVRFTAPPVSEDDSARLLAFGVQVDARPVRTGRRTDDPSAPLTPEQVAGYLAKYATKSATDTTDQTNAHLRRVKHTADRMASRVEDDWVATGRQGALKELPYGLLGKWAHELGFRRHFGSKSHRYSVTLGQLRRARRRAQALIAEANRRGEAIDLAAMEAQLLAADDEAATTVVIGHWTYTHTGWETDGDVALANAAAARAREYAQERAARRHSEQPKERWT
jgi:hypothetical protein